MIKSIIKLNVIKIIMLKKQLQRLIKFTLFNCFGIVRSIPQMRRNVLAWG